MMGAMKWRLLWLLPLTWAVLSGWLWSAQSSSAFLGTRPRSSSAGSLLLRGAATSDRQVRLGGRTRMSAASAEAFLPSLPSDNIIDAVEKAGPRVTVADAAAAGGMSLESARKGLVDLAAALGTKADIQVTKSGDLVYVFPQNPRQALEEVSTLAKVRETWTAAKPFVFTLLRSAFGLALFVSLAVIFTAIIALSSSGSSDREDRRERDDDDGFVSGGFGGGGGFGFGPSIYIGPSPFDIFWYSPTPYYYEEPERMGFLEAIYSFVFGDGDPNAERDQKALAAVAALARRQGGVLTGEEMAPLLAPPSSYKASRDTVNVNESWLLDAVARLNGRPEVTKSGEIVYVFDDLRTTADKSRQMRTPSILEEKEVPFSLADEGQLTGVGLLGAFNVIGAIVLGVELTNIAPGVVLPAWLAGVQAIYPGLLAYAIGFFAAPALRYFNLQKDQGHQRSQKMKWQQD